MNKKIKICHLTTAHTYDDTRIFLKQCVSLSKKYNVSLININSPNELTTLKNTTLININYKAKNRIKRFLFTTYKVYKRAKLLNADVYHFHDPDFIPYGILLRLNGKKVIYDIHESYGLSLLDRDYIPSILKKPIAHMFNIFEKTTSRYFNYLIPATPFIESEFIKFNHKKKTINNYPILNELKTDSSSTKREDAICFVGNISKERGFYEMIKATKKTKTKLYLAGNIPKELKKELSNNTHVIYLGFINRKEYANLIQKCIAGFVIYHPSNNHINSQPNKLFEYMSAELPIIGSNFSLWKKIIEENKCGICCDPLNINSIVNAINWMKENKKQLTLMGKNGFNSVKKIYNWKVEEKKLFNIYEEVIK